MRFALGAASRLRRVRGRRRRANRQPADHGGADRVPFRGGLLDRCGSTRPLLGVSRRPPDEVIARRDLPPRPGSGAGDRPRRRWWLRRQVAHLPGGAGPRVVRPRRGPASALDRDADGEHPGDAPRQGSAINAPSSAERATGGSLAYQLDVVQDAGAFPLIGASLPALTQRMATGVYEIDNVGFTGVSVVTNAVSTTAYRGAGRPEAAVAIERMVDRFAAEIGIDPAEVRRRNYVPRFTAAVHHGHRDGVRRRGLPRVIAPRPRCCRLRRAARRAGRPSERPRPCRPRRRTRHLCRGHRRGADAGGSLRGAHR